MSLVNHFIRLTLPITPKPIVRFFARRYVAGDRLDDAIMTVKRLREQGCCATVDVLGESVTSKEQSLTAVAEYLKVIDAITANAQDANISLKPTQMGLGIDESLCRDNIETIIKKAHAEGIFVRIDMEGAPTTDATLRIFRELIKRYPQGAGVVLQARLRRTLTDAAALGQDQVNIRLCKGIYLEPREIAYEERDIIRQAFVHALKILLQKGSYVGIATHDEYLVGEALALIFSTPLDRSRYEFQMLLGVDPELRRIIINSGHRLRVYVPYGSHWYPYSIRRLRENPTLARAAFQAFLKGRVD